MAQLFWESELSKKPLGRGFSFEKCCKNGGIQLQRLPEPPPLFKQPFGTNSAAAVTFRSNIRDFNFAFAYTFKFPSGVYNGP